MLEVGHLGKQVLNFDALNREFHLAQRLTRTKRMKQSIGSVIRTVSLAPVNMPRLLSEKIDAGSHTTKRQRRIGYLAVFGAAAVVKAIDIMAPGSSDHAMTVVHHTAAHVMEHRPHYEATPVVSSPDVHHAVKAITPEITKHTSEIHSAAH